jgi:hypothetical protein
MALTPTEISTLSSEIKTDPIMMGYDLEQTGFNLRLLNRGNKNTGGEEVPEKITVFLFLKNVAPADIETLTPGGTLYLNAVLGQPLETEIDNLMVKLYKFLPTASTTEARLSALTRKLSRAEVLFGEGAVISKSDFLKARDM